VPLGLSAVLDVAEPGQRILAVAYGSGAGSDAFDITVTDEIKNLKRDAAPSVKSMVENKVMLDYAVYAKYRGKIRMREAAE